jgi:ParB family chromosome partitioning protein
MELEFHQLDLRYEPLRVRRRETERRLLGSLSESGQQVPIVVVALAEEPGRYVVIDGHRRIRALRKLGRDTVSAMVWPVSEAEALLADRAQRQSATLSALEQGWLVAELQERHGLSGEELARRLGRSASWVSRHLGLVREIPQVVQEHVRAGRLGVQAVMKHLLPVCRLRREACRELAEVAVRERLNSRELGELCRAWLQSNELVRSRLLSDPMLFLRARRELAVSVPPRPCGDGPRRDLEVALALIRRADRSVSAQVPADAAALRGLATDAVAALQRLAKRLEEVERGDAEPQPAHHDPGTACAGDAAARDRPHARPFAQGGADGDPLRTGRGPDPRSREPAPRAPGADPAAVRVVPGQPGPGP